MNEARRFYRKDHEIETEPFHYAMCGLDDVYLMNGFTRKQTAHGEGVTVSDINGLHRAIGLTLIKDRKVLTPKELRFLRREMDYTQAELAAKIGQSSQQVARWEKGTSEIPGPAERLIRFLYALSLLPADKSAALLKTLMKSMDSLTKTDETSTPPMVFEETEKGWKRAA